MPLKLIYHPLSPYSRKVYVLALELNLASEITLDKVVVAPVYYPGWSDNNSDVAAAGNPIAKIPTLVVDDFPGRDGGSVGIFDSKFICEYLLQRAGIKEDQSSKRYWQEKAVHAASDGITDAEILVIYEERLREEKGLKWQPWVDGQREKVMRGFDFLEKMAGEGVIGVKTGDEKVSLAEVAAAVCLSFFDARQVDWRKGRSELEKFYQSWEKRESFVRAVSTREADWKRPKL